MPPPTMLGRSLRLIPRTLALQRQVLGCSSRRLYSQVNSQVNPQVNQQVVDLNDQTSSSSPSSSRPRQNRSPPRQYIIPEDATVLKHPNHLHYWTLDMQDPTGPIWHYTSSENPITPPPVVDRVWLRDACTCSKCVDPSSGQKRFATTDVDVAPAISKAEVTADGALCLHWENDFLTHDTHVSVYPSTLWSQRYVQPKQTRPKPWSRISLEAASPYFAYESFMAGGPEYVEAIATLRELGIIFLRGVPESEASVEDIASKMGMIQETFYGRTWDVKSKPDAENVAYTSEALRLHQDLLYMIAPPRIQILHCLKNTCDGGESIFSDGYRAAYAFKQQHKGLAYILEKRPVTYHYNKGGHIYQYNRPVLSNKRPAVWWSPPFQKPAQLDDMTQGGMHSYLKWRDAAIPLQRMIEAEENVFEYKMLPGECVIFDNPRVLHGRRAFDTSSGERWFKGTYIENSSFLSRLFSLELQAPDGKRTKGQDTSRESNTS
ncbi:Clavaminate synthase-like protein [Xylaria sp. FL1042]|nr:Clavaminate synthase-like protein [Xylaria sp. FL1042]